MDVLILKQGVPEVVTPETNFSLVQNTLPSTYGQLLFSAHGDIEKPWNEVAPGTSVKFDFPIYFMQKGWETVKLSVING